MGIDDISVTRTIDRSDEWRRGTVSHGADAGIPCVRLLYHADLTRLSKFPLMLLPAHGLWCLVGRNEPAFHGRDGSARPLDDPFVSRKQVRIRWLAESRSFEVGPSSEAKHPVSIVQFEPHGRTVEHELTSVTAVPPGSCILIGGRAILGLDLTRARDADGGDSPLLGECAAVVELREQIRLLGAFQRSVLVLGPTGVGKELVAQSLHAAGPRAGGRFITVNCAALPESLVESVLFGHRRGAFTGADSDQVGLIEAANGGTLFLDEVGELSRAIQPKLLRVLQDGMVVPVGAREGRFSDVRVIAATNRDPRAEIAAGRWREDLFHRLAGHELRVPALSERRFDIPALFTHFLEQSRQHHPALHWLWEDSREWQPTIPRWFFLNLLCRAWAGNVRELQNFAEQVAFHNLQRGEFRSPELAAEAIHQKIDALGRAPLPAMAESLGLAAKTLARLVPSERLSELAVQAEKSGWSDHERNDYLRKLAADALYELLVGCDFNQTKLAADLGISRTTLISCMEDLGLPRAIQLRADEILAACDSVGGNIDAAARKLHVSPRSLRKRLTSLGRE